MKSKPVAVTFPAPIYAETVLNHTFADGQRFFFEPLMQIHYAHALMLAKRKIISREEARAILAGLDNLDRQRILRAKYDGSVEDLYFYVERELANAIGEELAGKLHIARSRNDIDVTQYRMKLRVDVLNLTCDLMALRAALIVLAQANLKTVMPAHTHTQPAQPTTLAHYLSAVIEFVSRDVVRLRAAFANVNRNPLGACAITTTGFPINREHTARLLGFEGVVENSYYAIGGVDYLLEAVGALATSAVCLGKFTQDLLLWATQEFSFLTLNDGFVQTSSIMPQKRNPVALEHVRILLSRAFGQAQAVAAGVHNTPFGDINDVEDPLQPLVHNAFSDAARAVKLLAGAVGAVVIDRESLRRKAAGSFLTMTELADTLVRAEGLSFKMAHRLAAQTVKRVSGVQASHAEIADSLLAVARETLGRNLRLSREQLIESLSPLHFVEVRQVFGGPAPNQVADFLKRQKQIAAEDQRWAKEKSALLAAFPKKVEQERKQAERGRPVR
ncbi:MAG TPA: argininosuccinate lyase [Blastocatellia bacterium]|nr:argininosuccinate lyase [Blastocatellia bacterium]HMX24926.1 argininosuccinate lyase [Blastocatellia bacterium]HMZ17961.1 argininosuccinate lyase [Blastocatellia bacterium]HNG33660.1 argininosuccinate lyase [Blastocatellia bacterium]